MDKKGLLDIEDSDYVVSETAALAIMDTLLEIVLSFLTPGQAKGRIDKLYAQQANDIADSLEDQKFGKKN